MYNEVIPSRTESSKSKKERNLLVERIQSGDKSACAECIDKHGAGVYRLALRLMKNEADAEDVVQETFLNAFKAIDKFEGRSELSTWLYRITYNNAMMRLRRKQPDLLSIDESLAENDVGIPVPKQLFDWCCLPEQDFKTTEVRQELERAINELPASLRAVFVLREMEGLSTKETAVSLDLSTAAVKKRLQRARLWLRERLSGYFTEKQRVAHE